MPYTIHTIRLALPFHMSVVNCYLLDTGAGFVLIDTGGSNRRAELLRALEAAGCASGDLCLVVLTHGDFDHSGNAAYLRQAFSTLVALHPGDAAAVERGDMFGGRKKGNPLFRALTPLLFGFGRRDRFTPDIRVEDGYPLAAFGLDARVLCMPGHSSGSIGVLTAAGDLFCGDMFTNDAAPALNTLIDDPAAAEASLDRLECLEIGTVYPGHGQPFTMEQFLSEHRLSG